MNPRIRRSTSRVHLPITPSTVTIRRALIQPGVVRITYKRVPR